MEAERNIVRVDTNKHQAFFSLDLPCFDKPHQTQRASVEQGRTNWHICGAVCSARHGGIILFLTVGCSARPWDLHTSISCRNKQHCWSKSTRGPCLTPKCLWMPYTKKRGHRHASLEHGIFKGTQDSFIQEMS